LKEVLGAMEKAVLEGQFDMVELDCPDMPFENREDFSIHYFAPPKGIPPIRVFHRTSP
jgi:hypothetical protein